MIARTLPRVPQTRTIPAPAYTIVSAFDMLTIVERLVATQEAIALDLETTGLDAWAGKIVSIQFGTVEQAFIFDAREEEKDAHASVALALGILFSGKVLIVGHNFKFDAVWIAAHYGVSLAHLRVYDTMLAEQVILGGAEDESFQFLRADMASTAARYGIHVEKEPRSYFADLDRREEWAAPMPLAQLRYMALDVAVPLMMRERQTGALIEQDLEYAADLEMHTLPALAAVETHGVMIDVEGWRAYILRQQEAADALDAEIQLALYPPFRAYHARIQEDTAETRREWEAEKDNFIERERRAYLEAKLPGWGKARIEKLREFKDAHPAPPAPKALPERVNLGSTQQLTLALALVGVHVGSTDKFALERVKSQHPAIPLIQAWRKLNKLVDAFGETILERLAPDMRIHPSYWQIGADTGRTSCTKPNWQQLPSHETGDDSIRRHVIAPEGAKLLIADFSNIEARVLAELSGCPVLRGVFESGKDMHSLTAVHMFRLPAELLELPADDLKAEMERQEFRPGVSRRDAAKTLNYALMFGMGPTRLAESLGITFEEAVELQGAYFAAYPAIRRWLDSTAIEAERRGYTKTVTGRRRNYLVPTEPRKHLFTTWDAYSQAREEWRIAVSRVHRQACNARVQGTAADIAKLALTWLHQRLPAQAHMIAFVHDEVILEVPDTLIEEAGRILGETMREAAQDLLPHVAIPETEVKVAPYWRKK